MPAPQGEAPVVSEPVAPVAEVPPSVMLIRAEGDPRVYGGIHRNMKRHIPSAAVFNAYGYISARCAGCSSGCGECLQNSQSGEASGRRQGIYYREWQEKMDSNRRRAYQCGVQLSEVVKYMRLSLIFSLSSSRCASAYHYGCTQCARCSFTGWKNCKCIIQNSMYQIVSETEKMD